MIGDLEKSRRLYQTLQIPDFSSIEDVRLAYKALALKYHPDKNLNDPSAAEKFRDVRVAYEVLSNVERKQKYDCSLRMHQPLGASSFLPGMRTPRPGCPSDVGYNPYMSTGNATSNIYEEYNSYAAKKAGKFQRRGSPTATPREDRTSQYTEEQKEFFKKREKEHKAQLRKRREQERQQQRERELEALRREQDKRKGVQQLSSVSRTRRNCASTGSRRASPFSRAAVDSASRGETGKETSKVFSSRDIHAAAGLPDTVRPIPSPRPARSAPDPAAEQVERLRREKERQAEVRRTEQEKYLERLMKQRIREARLKEQEMEDAERREYEKMRRMLFLSEKSEREQVVEPQEQLERRRIWREHELSLERYFLQLQLRELVEEEKTSREIAEFRRERYFAFLYLHVGEQTERCKYGVNEDVTWRDIISRFTGGQRLIFMRDRSELIRVTQREYDAICFEETAEFGLIEVCCQEDVNRQEIDKESFLGFEIFCNTLQMWKEEEIMRNALFDQRVFIEDEEALEYAFLATIASEWIRRCELKSEEDSDVLQLIKQRACDRETVHRREMEEVRRAKDAEIASLQMELHHLLQGRHSTSLSGGVDSLTDGSAHTKPPNVPDILHGGKPDNGDNSPRANGAKGNGIMDCLWKGSLDAPLHRATPSCSPPPPQPLGIN